MPLAEFIRDNPSSRLALLWFDKYGEVQSIYCYSNKIPKEAEKLMGMEVMECNEPYSDDDDDWIEVWLK